ncbi:MAG: winged helix-turn-helix transcriptional regulator [Rhodobacteraceae bacterium]|jgi:DNA-binding MarR family transcriptional regulator|nr:winged helix-turn-helix transcriptional regulator [Paracoccaceae bacterium]
MHDRELPEQNGTEPMTPEDYNLYDTLSHLLRRSHFHAEAVFSRMMRPHGVTSRQLALMVAISLTPGSSQRSLGDRVALDMNTVSDLLKRMEKRGLVERKPSVSDGRSVTIWLTGVGQRILDDMRADNAAYQEKLTANLTDAETAELKRLLQKLLDLRAE